MPSELQIATIQAIVNIFETSTVRGDYSRVTLIPGDTGQLTFGRSQTTLTSGGLHLLIEAYCTRDDADLGADLKPFLDRLEAADPELNADTFFHNLLRCAADDPVMRETQDRFFDAHYFASALERAANQGIAEPLGLAVVYDSTVHGSWHHVRRKTNEASGELSTLGERTWVADYVRQRHDWLSHHRRSDLRATVYRTRTLGALVASGDWDLPLPLVVRGVEISAATLAETPRGVYDGPSARSRHITLTSPLTRGADVRRVQLALSAPGHDLGVSADGVFGRMSRDAVAEFQARHHVAQTGSVDDGVFDRLGL
jgi:chitosanase